MALFENFKKLLQLVLSNSQTVGQNAVLSDAAYSQELSDHIEALTSDQNLHLNTTNVELASGLLVSDANKREIRFEPKGSGKIVQGFLEANISDVRKIWQRSDDSLGTATTVPYGTLSDGRRYYVADAGSGVLYLNEYGQVTGAVPGFGDTVTGYGTPVSCLTFDILGVEYVAVLAAEHYLRVYLSSDFSLVATFGTPNTIGLPNASLLDTPTDMAFDEGTSTLYVSCSGAAGPSIPAGATGSGIVFSLDLSSLPAITFGSYLALDNGGALTQGQVVLPSGLFFDTSDNALWVLTGDSSNPSLPFEVGGLSVTGLLSDGYLKGYIEFRGTGFSTVAASKIHIDIDRRRLYLTNSPSVEVFDLVTMKHLYTFGRYGSDESALTTSAGAFYPTTGQVAAVGSDILAVDGITLNFALFYDATNNRIVRVGESLYEGSNVVSFLGETFTVPLSLHGYLVKGTLSSDRVQVEYRTSSTGTWQLLSQTDSVPSSTYFQFRLQVVADLSDVIQNRSIQEILVIGEQE